jgi:hypothetical protein
VLAGTPVGGVVLTKIAPCTTVRFERCSEGGSESRIAFLGLAHRQILQESPLIFPLSQFGLSSILLDELIKEVGVRDKNS